MATINFYSSPYYLFSHEIDPSAVNVFLAGPILGTGDWQKQAENHLRDIAHYDSSTMRINVFNPRRPQFKDLKDFSDDTFYEQVEWEHYHLARAKARGVTMFWLANKTIDMPHRNYGLTTLFELGEAVGSMAANPMPMVVGIEPGFTNEKYLHYTINKKAPSVLLETNLLATCFSTFSELRQIPQL